MELMLGLQEEMNLSYLFISHDLDVIYQMCDRVMVMEKGRIVESGPVEQIYREPEHPYTRVRPYQGAAGGFPLKVPASQSSIRFKSSHAAGRISTLHVMDSLLQSFPGV